MLDGSVGQYNVGQRHAIEIDDGGNFRVQYALCVQTGRRAAIEQSVAVAESLKLTFQHPFEKQSKARALDVILRKAAYPGVDVTQVAAVHGGEQVCQVGITGNLTEVLNGSGAKRAAQRPVIRNTSVAAALDIECRQIKPARTRRAEQKASQIIHDECIDFLRALRRGALQQLVDECGIVR
jgi:hypothetical protein